MDNITREQAVEKLNGIITGLNEIIAKQRRAINNIIRLLLDYAEKTEGRINALAGINTNKNFCQKCGAEIEQGEECFLDDIIFCSDCYDFEVNKNSHEKELDADNVINE